MILRERAGRLGRYPIRNRNQRVVTYNCRYGCGRVTEVSNMSRRGLISVGKAPSGPIALRTVSTGGAGPTTSWSVTHTATILNECQIFIVAWSKGSAGNPTFTLPSGVGWTLVGGMGGNQATLNSGAWFYYRIIDAANVGATGFTVTSSASVTATWLCDGLINVDTASPIVSPTGLPYTMASTSATSAQSATTLPSPATTDADGQFSYSFIAGRGPTTGAISQAFTINTARYTTNSGRAAFVYTASRTVATAGSDGADTPTYTNTQGSANTVRGAVVFRKAV